ncbi:Bgt-50029 [Blumeria graminis f. sp. tritici]|uniref:Bgt-50029 n=1 Tax=Blumeria graminis f. sp. tritici TaxID=62690 RepID=A0A9X9LBL2_BLUGR|nr:Bgt-50029 [Blumeria graminis f. sp. tritici]
MFTPSFKGLKGLAKNLRTIIYKDGTLSATPEDRGSIYRGMIMAFEETIEDIKGKTDLWPHESIYFSYSSFADKPFTFSQKNHESNLHSTPLSDL